MLPQASFNAGQPRRWSSNGGADARSSGSFIAPRGQISPRTSLTGSLSAPLCPAPRPTAARQFQASQELRVTVTQELEELQEEELELLQEAPAPEQAPQRPPLRYKQGVVIVGGGPAGLASAIMLAERGWTDITVVEKREDVAVDTAERAYVYRVDRRGEQLLQHINMPGEVVDRYAHSTGLTDLKMFQPDGSVTARQLVLQDSPGRWMQRSALIRMLKEDGLGQLGAARGWAANIRVLSGHTLESMERLPRLDGGWEVKLTVADVTTGATQELYPQLVIGSDGVHSAVRTTLMQWEQQDRLEQQQQQEQQPGEDLPSAFSSRFELQKLDSPSAGLKYKVLSLPPRPVLSKAAQPLEANEMAVVVGADKALHRRVRLGFMPVSSAAADAPRSCTIIMPTQEHELLNVKDAEGLYKYLEAQVPQLPVRELIPEEEAARFAQARPGAFPAPQHVNGLQYSARAPGADIQGYGVVLVGDARAAFPPDAGQGVNSALEDVVQLAKALDEGRDNIPAALERYEAARLPDIKALAQLMTFAGPWQYQQNPARFMLWGLDVMLRDALAKVAPALFTVHVMKMVQAPRFSYSRALELHQTTTQRLWAVGAALGAVAVAAVAACLAA